MTSNKETVRSYFKRFVNGGNMAVAGVIFAPDVRFHYPPGDLNDVDAVKSYIAAVRTAFPDLRFTIEDPFGEGERVAVRWSLVGTQTGEFRGKPPTAKQVKLPGNTNLPRSGGYDPRNVDRLQPYSPHVVPRAGGADELRQSTAPR